MNSWPLLDPDSRIARSVTPIANTVALVKPEEREVSHLTYLQSLVIGLLQGITELFPVSSLGHSVLVPALIGGSWSHLAAQSSTQSSEGSPYLAFIVALHVATALALLAFFWRDWVRLIAGFFRTLRTRHIETPDERLAWLLVVATIPAGVLGLAFEHLLRTLFAKPLAAAIFLTLNGVILLAGERARRRAPARSSVLAVADGPGTPAATRSAERASGLAADPELSREADAALAAGMTFRESIVIGVAQTLALLAGISRSGVTMVAGLVRGLDHERAARFAFLLATPIILAAGLLKLPTLVGPAGDGIRGQVLAGACVAAVAAYLSVRFLTRWFETRTLTPFAIYSLVVGVLCIVRFA